MRAVLAVTHHHGAVLADAVYAVGIVAEEYRQRERAFKQAYARGYRGKGIALIQIAYQLRDHLGIGIRHEIAALVDQHGFQLDVVFYNAVMHQSQTATL